MLHTSFSPKRSSLVAFLALVLAVFGCFPNEPTPDRPSGDWQVLALTDEANSRYIEYAVSQASAAKSGAITRLTALVVNPNLFLGKGASGIGGRVSKIRTFRPYVYVFLPEQRRIEILDGTTYQSLKTLDFTAQNRIPSDIIAVNATTSLIAFENDVVLSKLDTSPDDKGVTRFILAGDIVVGRNPVALEVRQIESTNINEVYCALRGDNQIAVITANGQNAYSVTARINVPTAPQYLQVTVSKQDLLVVSAGGGRYDASPRTALRVCRINLGMRRVTQQAPVVNTADSTTEVAYGLAVTDQDFAYIPTNKALYQVDVQNIFATQNTLDGTFRSVNYNPIRNEVLVAEVDSANMTTSCIIVNPRNGRDSLVVPLPDLRVRPRQVFTK
jgi:hypothetical protein